MMKANKGKDNSVIGEIVFQDLKITFNPLLSPTMEVTFDDSTSPQTKLESIVALVDEVNSFSHNGFLSSHDLNLFPVINKLLPFFINHKEPEKSEEYICGSRVDESFK